MKAKRIGALALVLALCLSLGALADTSTTATVPVTLTVDNEYRAVNVTVPASLPIHVINGTVVTADNAKITNNSTNGAVRVTGVEVTDGAYRVGDYNSFSGAHRVALKINGCATTGAGKLAINSTGFPVIQPQSDMALVFLASVVPVVFIFALAAVTAVGVAAVLAAVVILPVVIYGYTVADTVVHKVATVFAILIPVAAVPFAVRPVVVAVIRLPAATAATLSVAAERAGVAGESVRAFKDYATANAAAGAVDAVKVGVFVIGTVVVICVGAVPGTGAARQAAVRSVRKRARHEREREHKDEQQGY